MGDVFNGGGGRIALEAKLADKPWRGELGHIHAVVVVIIPVYAGLKARAKTTAKLTYAPSHMEVT